MSRTSTKWVLSIILALACFCGWLGYIGYFGGPIFYYIPATAHDGHAASGRAHHDMVAVLFSGDMGFKIGMGPKIARRLSEDGVPVVGINSLSFFRTQKNPAQVEALVTMASRRALAWAHADHLLLIGQSFGADMLHVGVVNLPPDLKAKTRLVALFVPGETVIYRASPSEMFNWATPDATALPTARLLNWAPVLCVRGKREDNSLCPHLTMNNVRHVALPGGHALNRDVWALYATLRSAIAESAIAPHRRKEIAK